MSTSFPMESTTLTKLARAVAPLLLFLLLSDAAAAQAAQARFVKTPTAVTAKLGSTVVLPCSIEGAVGSPQWTQNGFGLGTDRSLPAWERYKMIGLDQTRDFDLEIRGVRLCDDAVYQCQATANHLRSDNAALSVLAPPDNPDIVGGAVQRVIENREVTLKCVASKGKPAAQIRWEGPDGRLINKARYDSRATNMSDPRCGTVSVYDAVSAISVKPTKLLHNKTFKCEAWNLAGKTRAATVRLDVRYSPSVSVLPARPGPDGVGGGSGSGAVREGERAGFRCQADANPAPFPDKYEWFVDDVLQVGQYGFFFEMTNVSRRDHGRQVKCSVQNDLGVASGVKSIHVTYGPWFVVQPRNVAGNEGEMRTLKCAADGNPEATYYWTKGARSREPISDNQNYTLRISGHSVGQYFCHAMVPGFPSVTSRSAEVVMNARPFITNPAAGVGTAFGVPGQDAQIDCAARSVPTAEGVEWRYHGVRLDEANSHYRIIDTPVEHGLRSTLIVRDALPTDFGTYTCVVNNAMGYSEAAIELERQGPFPLVTVLVVAFAFVTITLIVMICLILFRKRFPSCSESEGKKQMASSSSAAAMTNNMINNLGPMSSSIGSANLKQERSESSVSPFSNEANSAWEGSSDNADAASLSVYGHRTTVVATQNVGVSTAGPSAISPPPPLSPLQTSTMFRSAEPEFPPKPDVVATSAYVPYGTYVRDYRPPPSNRNPEYTMVRVGGGYNCGLPDPLYSSVAPLPNSMLNVSDPRLSATYGNPHLRQTGPVSIQYSTFRHPPTSMSPPMASSSNNNSSKPQTPIYATSMKATSAIHQQPHPLASTNTVSSLGGDSAGNSKSSSQTGPSSSTPNSSIGNVASASSSDASAHFLQLSSTPSQTPTPPRDPLTALPPPMADSGTSLANKYISAGRNAGSGGASLATHV